MTNEVMPIQKNQGVVIMEKLNRSFRNLVTASALASAFAAAGCEPSQNTVTGSGEAFQRSGKLSTLGSVIELNGTYGPDCLVRSGQWSLATTAVENMTNPALDVVRGNIACTLTLDSLRIGTSEASAMLYTADNPIPVGMSFQPAGVPFRAMGSGPVMLYGNVRLLPDMSFSSNFTLEAIYSDDPQMVSANVSAAFEVVGSEAIAGAVPAPNYGTDVTGMSLQVDADNIVTAARGAAVLQDSSQTGEAYLISATDFGAAPQHADVEAEFTAGAPTPLMGANPSIDIAAFGLMGANLSSPFLRTIIIAHEVAGIRSYQVIAIRFFGP